MPDTEYDFDLFTIGAGSGGVRASRVSAAHGAKVAVAEEHRVGGTCVIRGCVPKKMLVYGAHFAEDLKDARNFGWSTENATFDWITLRDNVLKDVERIEGAYTNTLESHEVTIFKERAEITGPHEITLASGKVVTAYRPDPVLDPDDPRFIDNVKRFCAMAGEDVGYAGYLRAHEKRRADFRAAGATSTDHGHPSAFTVCVRLSPGD